MKKTLLLLAITGLLQAAEEKTLTVDYLKNHQDLIPKVVDIWYSGQKNLPVKPTEGMTAALQKHCNDKALPICLIALEDNEPVGMVRLVKEWTTDPEVSPWIAAHPEAFPWICGLIVKESHRRRGIARTLVDAVKAIALEMGSTTIYLGADDNDPYKAVYAKHGCVEIAQTTFRGESMTVMKYEIKE